MYGTEKYKCRKCRNKVKKEEIEKNGEKVGIVGNVGVSGI
jgi:hypothetical protein